MNLELDALAAEYKRDYGYARGNLSIADFVNNPSANGVVSVFSLLVPEESSDFLFRYVASPSDDGADSPLVTE